MSTETIQKDVSEEEIGTVDKSNEEAKGMSAREEMMNSIVSELRGNESEEAAEPVVVEDEVETEVEVETEAALTGSGEEEKPKEEDEDLITLKVDGKEVQVPREKVIEAGQRTLQKETTADAKLRNINKRQKELDELEQQLSQKLETLSKPTNKENKNIGKAFAESIFDDEDKVAEVVNQLVEENKTTKETVMLLLNREQKREEDRQQQVIDHYHETYDDIASDEIKNFAMNRYLNEVRQAEPNLSTFQQIDKAASKVHEVFGGKAVPGDVKETTEKENPKKSMPRPVSRAGSRMTQKPEAKPKTKKDVIREMAASRGRPAPI